MFLMTRARERWASFRQRMTLADSIRKRLPELDPQQEYMILTFVRGSQLTDGPVCQRVLSRGFTPDAETQPISVLIASVEAASLPAGFKPAYAVLTDAPPRLTGPTRH